MEWHVWKIKKIKKLKKPKINSEDQIESILKKWETTWDNEKLEEQSKIWLQIEIKKII